MQDTVSAYSELAAIVRDHAETGASHATIYDLIEADYSDLVDAFIADKRRELVIAAVRDIVGHTRRQRMRQARFSEAATRVVAGESVMLANFPSADGGRKVLGLMTKDDLQYAASIRSTLAQSLVDESRILRQLARKVPKGRTVSEVFTAEQLADFLSRIGGLEIVGETE